MIGFAENGMTPAATGTGSQEISPVNNQNIDECVSVYIKAYNCPPWNYHWTFEKARQYLLEYCNSHQFVGFALYNEKAIVGAAFAHTKTWWTNEQLMIDEFFISQERQGHGYGRKLLAYFDQYCRENGIGSIVLMTSKYMPAFNFYEKNGYTTIDPYVFLFKQATFD